MGKPIFFLFDVVYTKRWEFDRTEGSLKELRSSEVVVSISHFLYYEQFIGKPMHFSCNVEQHKWEPDGIEVAILWKNYVYLHPKSLLWLVLMHFQML